MVELWGEIRRVMILGLGRKGERGGGQGVSPQCKRTRATICHRQLCIINRRNLDRKVAAWGGGTYIGPRAKGYSADLLPNPGSTAL